MNRLRDQKSDHCAITELSFIIDIVLWNMIDTFKIIIYKNANVTLFCDDKQDITFHKLLKIGDIFDYSK